MPSMCALFVYLVYLAWYYIMYVDGGCTHICCVFLGCVRDAVHFLYAVLCTFCTVFFACSAFDGQVVPG